MIFAFLTLFDFLNVNKGQSVEKKPKQAVEQQIMHLKTIVKNIPKMQLYNKNDLQFIDKKNKTIYQETIYQKIKNRKHLREKIMFLQSALKNDLADIDNFINKKILLPQFKDKPSRMGDFNER